MERGDLGPIPTVDEALAWQPTAPQNELLIRCGRRLIVGNPHEVRSQIEELAEAYGADEVLAVTIVHDHEARRRSYELLADVFDLEPAPEPVSTVAFTGS